MPTPPRSIVIDRGPAILAQFRLQNGCDLVWAYSGDDPDLFETLATVPTNCVLSGKTIGTPATCRARGSGSHIARSPPRMDMEDGGSRQLGDPPIR